MLNGHCFVMVLRYSIIFLDAIVLIVLISGGPDSLFSQQDMTKK